MYILHSLGTLLVPRNSWKITLNYAKYLNEDLSTLGTLNWGQYVVDTLLEGLDGFQTKSSYPSGDFNFLVVLHLLDMVHLDGLSAPKSPTCAYWDDGRVSEAALMMKNNDGVWDFKLRRREQLKGLPLSETPWLDELFETIPTQPTQDFATSSVCPVPTTFSGPTDGWAELVDVASADVGQLALMRQIAEAEVKYKRNELRGMEAHCRLWEARLTVIENNIKMKIVVVEDNTDALDSQKNVEVENTEEKGEEDGSDDDEEDGKKGAGDDDDDGSSDDDDGSSDDDDGSSDDDDGSSDDDAGDEGNEDDNDEDDGSEDDDDKEDGGDNEKKDKAVSDRKEDSSSSSSDDDDDDDEEEDEEVYKDKAPTSGQGQSNKQGRPLGETVVVPRPSPHTSEEMTSDSMSDSEEEVPNVGDIGKEAAAQAEKDIPENEAPRFVKVKLVQTPVFYDRPKTGSKTIGSPYVVEERVKNELTMDERIIVKCVLRDDDRVYVLLVPSSNVCYVCYMETDHVNRTEVSVSVYSLRKGTH
ncbi:Replicase polyprotein 1a [Linum perenne]